MRESRDLIDFETTSGRPSNAILNQIIDDETGAHAHRSNRL